MHTSYWRRNWSVAFFFFSFKKADFKDKERKGGQRQAEIQEVRFLATDLPGWSWGFRYRRDKAGVASKLRLVRRRWRKGHVLHERKGNENIPAGQERSSTAGQSLLTLTWASTWHSFQHVALFFFKIISGRKLRQLFKPKRDWGETPTSWNTLEKSDRHSDLVQDSVTPQILGGSVIERLWWILTFVWQKKKKKKSKKTNSVLRNWWVGGKRVSLIYPDSSIRNVSSCYVTYSWFSKSHYRTCLDFLCFSISLRKREFKRYLFHFP